MTTASDLRYERDDGLITITIDRPPLNVLDIPLMEALAAALARAAADPEAKLVLLTATGEKAFCAGVEVADHVPERVERMVQAFGAIFRRLEDVPVPTVAALNGAALGGGCELAIGCDMAVAAAHAKIGQPEIKLGVFPPVAAALLARRIAPARAYELVLGGEALGADEARACGLLNQVYPREAYAEGVRAYAATYLRHSRPVLALAKKALRAARGRPFLEALAQADAIYLHELMATRDAREGLAAFLEKRAPVWTNQ